jgi:hypothetical protein
LYDGFAAFHPVLRQVCDLEGLVAGVDIVVMSNSLHEIQPRHFAAVFRTFNGLIHSERGRICVVDMEWLPEDGPESIAITWKGSEVEEFLAAAGFAPIVTTHSKSVSVYRAFAKHLTGTFDESAMNDVIIRQLTHKLDQAVSARRKAEAQLGPNPEGIELVKEWVVATGTLARVAEELAAMKPPA